MWWYLFWGGVLIGGGLAYRAKQRRIARVRQAAIDGVAADPWDLRMLRSSLFPVDAYKDLGYLEPLTPEEAREKEQQEADRAREKAQNLYEARLQITPLTPEELEEAKQYVETRYGWRIDCQ